MDAEPLVSVIISSCDRPALIRDALASVREQSWPTEIIVADDWSGDETWRVFREHEPLVVVTPGNHAPTERNGRRCANGINAALAVCLGEFVAFLPDDDWMPPGAIRARAAYLRDHLDVNCVYGRLESCKSQKPTPRHQWEREWGCTGRVYGDCRHDRNGFWEAAPIQRAANRVDHGMMMVRRRPDLPVWPTEPFGAWEVQDDCSDSAWFNCPDAGWFYRLEKAGLGPFHSVPDVVVVKRYHGETYATR